MLRVVRRENISSELTVELSRPHLFFGHNSRAGIFSLQPFFDEHVCFIFPPEPIPPQYDPFEIGVEFLWFNQAWDPNVNVYYNQSKFDSSIEIAGQPCDLWVIHAGLGLILDDLLKQGPMRSTLRPPLDLVVSRVDCLVPQCLRPRSGLRVGAVHRDVVRGDPLVCRPVLWWPHIGQPLPDLR